MAMCEDFPCCGHEAGCCPRFDESGLQLDMVCVCGTRLPGNNPTSICNTCLREGMEEYEGWTQNDEDELSDMNPWDDTPMADDYGG